MEESCCAYSEKLADIEDSNQKLNHKEKSYAIPILHRCHWTKNPPGSPSAGKS